MRASSSQRVQFDLLRLLGVREDDVQALRTALPESEQLVASIRGEAGIGALERVAGHLERTTGVPRPVLPVDKLRQLLAVPKGERLDMPDPVDFPVPAVTQGADRVHSGRLDASVSGSDFGKDQEAVTRFLQQTDPALAERLEAGSATVGELARALSDPKAMGRLGYAHETALASLGRKGGPEHTARDVEVDLGSKYTRLDGQGGVELFQKRSLDWLTAKRDRQPGQFTVHGFERDALVVTVPKGARVLVLDGAGHQHGARAYPKKVTIDGEERLGVTIDRSLVQHPDRPRVSDPELAVKVIDGQGELLYERAVKFSAKEARTSTRIFSGSLAAQPSPDPTIAEFWDHFVPDRSNPAPVGQRPRFEVDGATGDRLRIRRDGQTFDLSRLHQFLEPPRSTKQFFKIDKGVVELDYQNTNRKTLDDPGYEQTASGKLRMGSRGFTFDRSLSLTRQARWGARGIELFDETMRHPLGRFDPLDPDASLQPGKAS